MTVERYIRVIAGAFILASLALAHWHSVYWLWFTAFVGVNLFQSGLTNWCLMEKILKKCGIGQCEKSRDPNNGSDKSEDATESTPPPKSGGCCCG